MFIGEMGSWLVIGIFTLVRKFSDKRHKARKSNVHFSVPNVVVPHDTDPLLVRGEEEDEDEELEDDDPLASSMVMSSEGRRPLDGWKVTYLALPAVCDICGTTLMNVGLLFVAASIYQMTRGALVLFVGLFSLIFLKRKLPVYKWFALFVVVAGVAVVGLAGALAKDKRSIPSILRASVQLPTLDMVAEDVRPYEVTPAVQTIIGVLLIAAAQIFTATQFVVEESIMEKYSIEPLKAVGWEGLWGFVVTIIGMVILHFAYGITPAGKGGYFDMKEGLWQVMHFRQIAVSSVLIMISIG